MSRAISPYDRHDSFWESGGVTVAILTVMALIASIVLHLAVLWVFLFLLAAPPSLKIKPEEYITVQLLGDMIPSATAAPAAPVDPDLKGPSVVEAPKSDPTLAQPNFAPPDTTITAPADVIPLGPKAPETPPVIAKKAKPPEVKAPKVVKDPPPKPKETKTNPDAELNNSLAALRRRVEAKNAEAPDAQKYDIDKESGGDGGDGSRPSGGASGLWVDPVMASYFTDIREKVKNNWSWGALPGVDESKLSAVITVTIQPNGTITNSRVTKGSGNQDFDNSVARAVARSVPFSPPPAIFGGRPINNVQLVFTPAELRQ